MNCLVNAVARLCLKSTSNRLKEIVTECSDANNCIQQPELFLNRISQALATSESHGLSIDTVMYFRIHNAYWFARYMSEFEPETISFTIKNSN